MAMPALELGWVAGFLEGEGCFRLDLNKRGNVVSVYANQVQFEPLERLKRYTGIGKIHGPIDKRRHNSNASPIYEWVVRGRAAAELVRELRPFMSPKRQVKIDEMLAWFDTRRTRGQWFAQRKIACRHGHVFTPENIYIRRDNNGFECRTCRKSIKTRVRARRRKAATHQLSLLQGGASA